MPSSAVPELRAGGDNVRQPRNTANRIGAAAGAALLAAVLTAGCGTRVDRQSQAPLGADATPASDLAAAPEAPVDGTTSDSGSVVDSAPAGGAGTVGTTPSTGPSSPAASGQSSQATAQGGSPSPSAGTGRKTPTEGEGTRGAPGKGTASAGSGAAVAPTPAPANPGKKSPLVLASIGTYSGPAASTIRPILEGAQLWVKDVNARGGVNGHPVQLLVYDDAGDPARHTSQLKEAVERRKIAALLANGDALTGQGVVKYLEEKRIPHIGTMFGLSWTYSTPMYFPQWSESDAGYVSIIAGVANQVLPEGKKKLGTLMCAEAQGCQDAGKVYAKVARELGLEHVYKGNASIAQPDYTAECLAARNAGVQVMLVFLDSNSMGRLAASCRRQGFDATIATGSVISLDRFKDDPNLDGTVVAVQTFPWFQSGTPATDDFQRVLKTLGGGLTAGAGTSAGWTTGKLLEKAGANLAEPPTNEAVLAGLWTLRNETLGGLTPLPLTFLPNQPTSPKSCWYELAIRDGRWVSHDGFKPHCR